MRLSLKIQVHSESLKCTQFQVCVFKMLHAVIRPVHTLCAFVDKYPLIGTLVSDCSCHSNANSATAAAAAPVGGDAPASEGINTAAPVPSGICVLV